MFKAAGVNRIEQMTFALTCMDHEGVDQPLILGSHVDHLNDPRWPEVFCIYRHFFEKGKLFRLAAIAYSRSIIGKYEFKDVAYTALKRRIESYLKSPSNVDRIQLSLLWCLPKESGRYRNEDGISFRMMVPFLDKAGFYSGFADAILGVWDGSDCERACELLIICGWISMATSYQKILSRWRRTKFRPSGIWTLAYLEESITRFGGLTHGPGPRTQPWMNYPLTYGAIVEGLNILRDVFGECRRQHTSDLEEGMPYPVLHQKIEKIMGVGPLGAQHVIGVASLIGIVPAVYQNIATIARTTRTAKKVKEVYMLSATVLEKQKAEVAEELEITEKIVEAAYCEMFREEDTVMDPDEQFDEARHEVLMSKLHRAPKHPDTFFQGQILRTTRGKELVEMYWDEEGQEQSRIVPPIENFVTHGDSETGWWVKKRMRQVDLERMIPTSLKHSEDPCPEILGGKRKKRQQKRGRVVHTGFGVHQGLETRLKEGKFCEWYLYPLMSLLTNQSILEHRG